MGDIAAVHRASFTRCSPATAAAFPEPRRMSDDALSRFLDRKQYLVLASTRTDGRPHAAMSAFLLFGGRVWCPTMAGTVRTRSIARDPRVSIVVTEGEANEHAVVLVEGEAALVAEGEEPDGFMRRYREKFGAAPDWARSWIVVDPTQVLSFAAEGWT
jgi:nitroimidazol reductase NimA-like FMN-containing flavoprotein (pyridoxamine 5'-phosphate oxidase superfamily)